MKSLHRLALCAATIASLLALPVLAASGPPDVPTPGQFDLVHQTAAPSIAPQPAHNMCMFAIVEDLASCTIGVAAVAGDCPEVVARVIGAMGAAVIASPSFVATCAGPPPLPD